MRRIAILAAAIATSAVAFAPAASAAGEICYDAYAEANGGVLVDESACVPLP